MENCKEYEPQRVEYPKLDKNGDRPILQFTHYNRQYKHPWVGVGDMEAMLLKTSVYGNTCITKSNIKSKYSKVSKHMPLSWGYYDFEKG